MNKVFCSGTIWSRFENLRRRAKIAGMSVRALCLFTLGLLSGCPEVWLPAPDPQSRDEITEGAKRDIEVGKTTRIDVLLALGEPDQRASDDSWFTYGWKRSWAVGLYPVAVGEETVNRLTISFNENGIVSKADLERHKCPSLEPGKNTSCSLPDMGSETTSEKAPVSPRPE